MEERLATTMENKTMSPTMSNVEALVNNISRIESILRIPDQESKEPSPPVSSRLEDLNFVSSRLNGKLNKIALELEKL